MYKEYMQTTYTSQIDKNIVRTDKLNDNQLRYSWLEYKGNNKITDLRTILQRESQNP
jgi:hypothetical protein